MRTTRFNHLFLLLTSFLLVSKLGAQELNDYVGTLELEDQSIITFRLQFKDIGNGQIEGHTLTDIFGKDKTKSTIQGTFNKQKGVLSFTEKSNVNSISKEPVESFCFLHVTNASLSSIRGKSFIQGRFIGKFASGEQCAKGKFFMVKTEDVTNKLEELNKQGKKTVASIIPEQPSKDTQPKDVKDKEVGDMLLKNNDVKKFNWQSEEVLLEIWDSKYNDGDEIAIYVNGKKVQDRFVLDSVKKTLVLPFEGPEMLIRVEALEEGTMKLCTATLSLIDKEKRTTMVTVLKPKQKAILRLVK